MKVRAVPAQQLLLTVGLIVKNEEKHLRNCLSAIEHLLEQIPGEIIIADTGSTDATVEIAKEFTDNVFHFEWINDFAAARNSVIDRAKGEWFLCLDADEYLDSDVKELVEFLKSGNRRYEMGSLFIHNYNDVEGIGHTDFQGLRLFRPASGNRYTGAIHEALETRPPIKFLKTIIHHYGYTFESQEQIDRKQKRNMTLILERLEQEPENVRTLTEAAESCFGTNDDIQYLERGVTIGRKDPDNPYVKRCFYLLIKSYMRNNEMEDAYKLGQEVLELYKSKKDTPVMIDIYYMLTLLSCQQLDIKEMLQYYRKYEEIISKLETDTELKQELLFSAVEATTPVAKVQLRSLAVKNALESQDYDTALLAVCKYEIDAMDLSNYANTVKTLLIVTQFSHKNDGIILHYRKYRSWIRSKDKAEVEKAVVFNALFENFFLEQKELRDSIASEFEDGAIAWKDDSLVRLIHLYHEHSEDKPNFEQQVQEFVKNEKDWERVWALAYYWVLKCNIPLPQSAILNNQSRMSTVFGNLAVSFDDFTSVLLDYSRNQYKETDIRWLQWMVMAMDKAVIYSLQKEEDTMRNDLIDVAANYIWVYLHKVYTPEVLNDDTIVVLPFLYQFGYYYYSALQCLEQGDELGFVRRLRAVLDKNNHSDELVKLVEYIIKDHEKGKATQDLQQEETNETMKLLAQNVKRVIYRLIDMGCIAEAQKALDDYRLVSPTDPDILEIEKNIQNRGVPQSPLS